MPAQKGGKTMLQITAALKQLLSRVMLLAAGVVAAAVVAMRIWLMPSIRDWETGLFSPNYLVIILMLLCVVALVVVGRLCGPDRRDITGRPALSLGIALLVAGLVLVGYEVVQATNNIPALLGMMSLLSVVEPGSVTLLPTILQVVQNAIGIAGGGALILLALRLFSEGNIRRGIAQWSALLPVVWMWVRLINYEMSYSSMVRLQDSFFGFVMLLMEMWFLFKLARYVSGVGQVSMGSLLACSLSTAVFALSAPIVRLSMWLMGDYAAYASSLSTVVDFAIGALVAVVAVALVLTPEPVQESKPSTVDAEAAAEFASSEAYIVADLVTSVSDDEEPSTAE